MPPQLVLTDILLKFQVQVHQLTPNAFAQFSMYFCVMISFSGKPSSDGFVKRYELHYQPKKVEVDGGEKFQQFGCLNFHARCGGGACACVHAGGKGYVSSTLAHVQPGLSHRTAFRLCR
jgi:hypothetical protein